jgi:hypothetical protein
MIRDKVNIILTQNKRSREQKSRHLDGFKKVIVKCLAQPNNQIVKNSG